LVSEKNLFEVGLVFYISIIEHIIISRIQKKKLWIIHDATCCSYFKQVNKGPTHHISSIAPYWTVPIIAFILCLDIPSSFYNIIFVHTDEKNKFYSFFSRSTTVKTSRVLRIVWIVLYFFLHFCLKRLMQEYCSCNFKTS
jgi:hypothetical protein